MVWGAQLEKASFPSSYIPTTTIAVARNGDVLTYANAIIDQSMGSMYCEATLLNPGAPTGAVLSICDGDTNDEVGLRYFTTTMRIFSRDAGVIGANNNILPATTSQQITKYAMSYEDNRYREVHSGGALTSDASSLPAGLTDIAIGADIVGGNGAFGSIKNPIIWDYQLPDAFLQDITRLLNFFSG